MSNSDHWNKVYAAKGEDKVSWFKTELPTSLELIRKTGIKSGIIDVGGGASRLIDQLVAQNYTDLTVLDISEQGLDIAKSRLCNQNINWIVADITQWQPSRQYNLWHDWAVFHFLNTPEQQARYVKALKAALAPGGQVIIAAFAPDGPLECSNLPITRHDVKSITQALGSSFRMEEMRNEIHSTPGGKEQSFNYFRLARP